MVQTDLFQNFATTLAIYCRIQFKSTPLHDRDTPDEIFFLSPHFGSCDMVKISSIMNVELYILVTFGDKFIAAVWPLESKLAIYWQKTQF